MPFSPQWGILLVSQRIPGGQENDVCIRRVDRRHDAALRGCRRGAVPQRVEPEEVGVALEQKAGKAPAGAGAGPGGGEA